MRFPIIKRERIKRFALSPYMFILLMTVLLIDWGKNPTLYSFRDFDVRYKIRDKVYKYTYIKGKKQNPSYLDFALAKGLHKQYQDTLTIRFHEKNKQIEGISITDYNNQKYAWQLGFVEYKKGENWYALHPNLDKDEDFILPFSAKYGRLPDVEQELLLEILPINMREDKQGNLTTVIKKWD